MAELVYVLCFLASAACAVLLLRGYRRSKTRFLLWGGLCFVGLAANNLLLFLDLVVFKQVDLSLWRSLTALIGLLLLLYGLVWDAE
jgi:hypothetical protein